MAKAKSIFSARQRKERHQDWLTEMSSHDDGSDVDACILEQKNAERDFARIREHLNDEINRWRLLVEQSRDGIVILDQAGRVYETNKRFADMLGYSKDEVHQLYVWDWDAIFSKEQIEEMIRTVDDSGDHFETQHRRKDGRVIDVELSNNGTVYRGEKLIFCICRDITEKKRLEQALRDSEEKYRRLSIIDELTQLYNSRYFYSQLALEIDRAERSDHRLTLMLFDIDDFKRFNDLYGHLEGDKVLVAVGGVLGHCMRHTDYAFRYGGDEFTVLLPDTDIEGGAILAQKIGGDFKRHAFPNASDNAVHLTLSIGLAEYRAGDDVTRLMQRADRCMYQAKKNGKDRVFADSQS
jgi:diguanylate cyclase (GGDEF)-like protein/PAS domain S-box-containing protein